MSRLNILEVRNETLHELLVTVTEMNREAYLDSLRSSMSSQARHWDFDRQEIVCVEVVRSMPERLVRDFRDEYTTIATPKDWLLLKA